MESKPEEQTKVLQDMGLNVAYMQAFLNILIPIIFFGLIAYLGHEGCKYKKWEKTLKRKVACITEEFGLIIALKISLLLLALLFYAGGINVFAFL